VAATQPTLYKELPMRFNYPTTIATPLLALTLVLSGACMVGEQDIDGTNPGDSDTSDEDTGDDNGSDEVDMEDEELGCATLATYSVFSAAEAETDLDDDGDKYYEYMAELSAAPLNQVEVSLWQGSGAFTNVPVAPGTYVISGEETSYEDCGVCIVLFGDVDSTDDARQMLMAQSGTIQVDSITGTMSGTLTDVVFKEVDPDTEVVKPDGCETTLSLPFSAPL
jgi:hypothetical protein